ncbi:isochorismatase family protein [Pseudovibrio sp. FO-BEG1]|uniref:SnoaL-like domain-containing protein n=2 Tax=Pseudovibrio denitrificans TaxID=258256 RepID=A0A1I7AMF9_9HYPH|nr:MULTISPECIES: nuclear transport factor 2 family protein [Pseudovibrio]AEV34715.1 isochorismatase family protein [Pseudovibrio sp. FO-BEG1]EEA93726.1 isochorismatase family protein [Pseudovibrio sp. JE062]SFT76055.1 SnoaL-like domain-containing protein [Pseudovibrio denitrificans]
MNSELEAAVKEASQQWQNAFNAGDAQGCANCYEANAVMEAKPFGTYHGRAEILEFWQMLIREGFSEVEYLNPKIVASGESSAILSSDWKMNKAHGNISKELWVLQPDGTALLREDYFSAAS